MIRNVLALGFVGLLSSAIAGGEALADPSARAEARHAWGDQAGWTYLGETRLVGWRDHGLIEVPRGQRRLDRIMLVARNGLADLRGVKVHLAGGESFVVRLGRFDGRAVIDVPDRGRVRAIELVGGRWGRRYPAAIQVFGDLRERRGYGYGYGYEGGPGRPGRDDGYGGGDYEPAPPLAHGGGWQTLGSAYIDGRRDRETIVVGRDEGRFRQLMLSTTADVGIHDVTVTLLSGQVIALPARAAMGGGAMVFDLPGDARGIREVSFSASSRGFAPNARVDLLAI
jgi:hypothetical protein